MRQTDRGFDAAREAAALKAEPRERRRRRFYRSRLDRHTHELMALSAEGVSAAELRRWLARRGVHVAHSTVARWLQRHGA